MDHHSQKRWLIENAEDYSLKFLKRVHEADRREILENSLVAVQKDVAELMAAAMNSKYEIHLRAVGPIWHQHISDMPDHRRRFDLEPGTKLPMVNLRFLKDKLPLIGVRIFFPREGEYPRMYGKHIEIKTLTTTLGLHLAKPRNVQVAHLREGNKYRSKLTIQLPWDFELPRIS